MSQIAIGGITIGYDEHGSGVPLVLVHGDPFKRSTWDDQVEAFASTFRVIVPDLRGSGETTVTPGKVTMEEMAGDLAALLDALAIDRVILGGISVGGQIVMEFYRQIPRCVRALLLADTQPQTETEQGRIVRYATAQRVLDTGMEPLADETLPKLLPTQTFAEHPEVVDKVRHMILGTNPEGVAAALRGRAERRDYTALLREITVPTLIVVGTEDANTPVSDAELMHREIADSRLTIFDDVAHMPNMERPGKFKAAPM